MNQERAYAYRVSRPHLEQKEKGESAHTRWHKHIELHSGAITSQNPFEELLDQVN